MDEPARNTPATDASFDLISRIAVDDACGARYPSGTVLIPGDAADTSDLISRAIAEERPIALVFRDGSHVVARPPTATRLARMLFLTMIRISDRLGGNRDKPTFVPRDWVTEFHAVPTHAGD